MNDLQALREQKEQIEKLLAYREGNLALPPTEAQLYTESINKFLRIAAAALEGKIEFLEVAPEHFDNLGSHLVADQTLGPEPEAKPKKAKK